MIERNRDFIFVILIFLFFGNVLAWIAVFDLAKTQFLEVNFFDVGQGDAIFIETSQSHQILIDGGPSSAILEKLGENLPFWDKSIDLIILTHPERDHLAGLIEVLKKYKIENILWTGVVRDTAEYTKWTELIKKEKAKIKIAQNGQRIKIQGSDPCNLQRSDLCVSMEILHPFENLEGREFKNSNNTSVVSKLNFNEISFLFTGDIYQSVEKALVGKNSNLDYDVLKIAHHGSKTSTSDEFLDKVLPEIAIIQVGENKYGHPHQEVLERLENFGIRVLRNDREDDIKIFSDGIKITIQ